MVTRQTKMDEDLNLVKTAFASVSISGSGFGFASVSISGSGFGFGSGFGNGSGYGSGFGDENGPEVNKDE